MLSNTGTELTLGGPAIVDGQILGRFFLSFLADPDLYQQFLLTDYLYNAYNEAYYYETKTYTYNAAAGSYQVTAFSGAPLPEPGTLALVLIGLIGLIYRQRQLHGLRRSVAA